MAPFFKRIVVPLDGSAFAEAALTPACALARALDAHIVLVRSIDPSGLPRMLAAESPGHNVATSQPDREGALERVDEADTYLHGMLDRVRASGLQASMALYLAEQGMAIARTAEVGHADLIVMTAHPRWKANLLDNTSTTLRVLARSRVPILAWRVPKTDPADVGADVITADALLPRTESPIVIPLDGSRMAEEALPVAMRIAAIFGAYLVLTRAVGAVPPNDRVAEEASAYLARVRDDISGHGIGASCVVQFGSPVGVIDAACREYDASLVIMCSHGALGPKHRVLGSVAAQAIEDLAVPVLVVHAHEDAAPFLPAGAPSYSASPPTE